MYIAHKKAFTMIELVFVIVVIGILAAVAIPKLAVTRDDAIIANAKATVGSVRSAIATERQKRILRGNFDPIYELSSTTGNNAVIFDGFDGNTSNPVLEYAKTSCKTGNSKGCWVVTTQGAEGTDAVYTFNMPITGTAVFELSASRFDCQNANDSNCRLLTQ